MVFEIVAILCAGLFAGAAIYVGAVEHPARLSCGNALALREFAPSYRRGAIMQATLALVGTLTALLAWWHIRQGSLLAGGLLLGANVPFTLLVIRPTNHRLMEPSLDPDSPEATSLLRRWGSMHSIRTLLGSVAFVQLLIAGALR